MYFTDKNRIKYFKTLIETPASERKKAREAFYLDLFLQTHEGMTWKGSSQLLDLPSQEHPDFLFLDGNGQQRGLELTDWVNNTKQCRVNQILTDIALDICTEVQKIKHINLSLTIDIYDPKKWECRTRKEFLDYVNNPGIKKLQANTKTIKKAFLDTVLNSGDITESFTTEYVEINEQYFKLTLSKSWFNFPEFHINNNSMYCENPTKALQEIINFKNTKYDSYLSNCKHCDLLIIYPNYHTGNPIFLETEFSFQSNFPNIFLLYWDGKDISVTKLNTNPLLIPKLLRFFKLRFPLCQIHQFLQAHISRISILQNIRHYFGK